MELKFLGRGAAFYPAFGNTNAFFAQGEDLFFLDFGEAAFEKAVRLLDLKSYRHIYVLLTHLHADHAGSLASLCSYTHLVLGLTIYVVHPVDTVVQLLRLEGIGNDLYHYLPALPPDCPVSAQFVPVQHASDMQCFGYVLRTGDDSLYFSGDAARLPEQVKEQFLAGEIKRIYHDTASHESQAHCWYRRLEDDIPPQRRGDVFCMHLDGDYADQLRQLGFQVVTAIA